MREKKVNVSDRISSNVDSRESHWRLGRVPSCSLVCVRRNSLECLWISSDIIGP